jgi:transcriptional regulator with GAF, ATPase, and Fis domain
MEMQVKLLRVLQEREIDRVGGSGPVAIDVRVIAATNRDLRGLVAAGKFREDLYYRLQGVVVLVPPLRERKQELPALVEYFRREVVGAGQSRVHGFSTDAMDELFRRDWPGNVRELRNVVCRAMVLAGGERVELGEVRAALPVDPGAPPVSALPAPAAEPGPELPADPGPVYVIPEPEHPVVLDGLPERVRMLYRLVCEKGAIRTQDHMQAHAVSHRTGLRDLQILVDAGLIERQGKRRGAKYQSRNQPPTNGA